MPDDLVSLIQELTLKAPAGWLLSAARLLRDYPTDTDPNFIFEHMPHTINADIAYLMGKIVRTAKGTMSWEALGWAIEATTTVCQRRQADHQTEFLLTGPQPARWISARRVDQVLYDLVQSAKSEITLITFAASRITHLAKTLLAAMDRGVKIKLILEFEQTSEGQLSLDALRAFPQDLINGAEVYYWPVEKRERNPAGKPGKLHAKVALIDDAVLISSANLTDDAFNRNFEVGVKLTGGNFCRDIREYIDGLCRERVLCPIAK
jgi:phosphatidylserine/phosphatidylglycerophosphate/cardiolipin synthase-like enzyme